MRCVDTNARWRPVIFWVIVTKKGKTGAVQLVLLRF